MKSTALLTPLLMVFSFVAGCSSVERPDTDIFIVNVPGLHTYGYNLKRDYADGGQIKKDAKPVIVQFESREKMLDALNKSACTNPDGLAHLKAYIRTLRETLQ